MSGFGRAASSRLRVDWLDEAWTAPGRLGLTALPGGRDAGLTLGDDIATLLAERTGSVLCLVPLEELMAYGVGGLLGAYRAAGLAVRHLPIPEREAGPVEQLLEALAWLDEALRAGDGVVVHCVGGLGRTGMAVASWLRTRGLSADEAIALVREVRSPFAIETEAQERLVHDLPVGEVD